MDGHNLPIEGPKMFFLFSQLKNSAEHFEFGFRVNSLKELILLATPLSCDNPLHTLSFNHNVRFIIADKLKIISLW